MKIIKLFSQTPTKSYKSKNIDRWTEIDVSSFVLWDIFDGFTHNTQWMPIEVSGEKWLIVLVSKIKMANDDSFIVSVAAVGNRFGFLYWTAAGNDLGKNEC